MYIWLWRSRVPGVNLYPILNKGKHPESTNGMAWKIPEAGAVILLGDWTRRGRATEHSRPPVYNSTYYFAMFASWIGFRFDPMEKLPELGVKLN
ncbi:hypothetical protein CROQUDRAFT_98091 [Cronartium quercuum f. sp. fusiforme G11]|uniref:Uncharacterized protein n=1 Tax=Cronartium quercuum f. sp. fusiforme G11 TaxID=708437 RepID=A0A9P6T8Y0_9BASI|nr:hypothetical protein CROQUDRAFT_98091 [Cronartium quercuum f. sp. fusiforme G11]